ncbi:MAG: hypothetical protein ABL929_05090 [Ferruginibacter sp.]|nr:hypothetical protein [Ferruginibacter sp.]
MSQKIEGKISFINHDKQYAMIDYEEGNKKKTVRVSIDDKTQKQMKEKNLIKKIHHFMIGDVVSFVVKLSDRGDRMVAVGTEFLYNNALDVLINKSFLNNKFIGYLKIADDKYFVKEIDSYLFFPVPFSPWQLLPTNEELNEQVNFSLENVAKKEKIFATLFDNKYIPEFEQAVKLFKTKTPVEATVFKVTPHAIHLNIVGNKIQAKIPFEEATLVGNKINVLITYLGKSKIAVEKIV